MAYQKHIAFCTAGVVAEVEGVDGDRTPTRDSLEGRIRQTLTLKVPEGTDLDGLMHVQSLVVTGIGKGKELAGSGYIKPIDGEDAPEAPVFRCHLIALGEGLINRKSRAARQSVLDKKNHTPEPEIEEYEHESTQ